MPIQPCFSAKHRTMPGLCRYPEATWKMFLYIQNTGTEAEVLTSASVPVSDCQKSRFAKNNAQKVFARLFRKGGGVKGRSPWRVPQDAKSFAFIRIRKGDATARWAVASWETLSRGFPMRRITPHLCNLLSANQFFDTLSPPPNPLGGGLL